CLQIGDANGPFQRVRGAHKGFEAEGVVGIAFELKQSVSEHGRLILHLGAKELEHRKTAQRVWSGRAHRKVLWQAASKTSESTTPPARSCQRSTPCAPRSGEVRDLTGKRLSSSV